MLCRNEPSVRPSLSQSSQFSPRPLSTKPLLLLPLCPSPLSANHVLLRRGRRLDQSTKEWSVRLPGMSSMVFVSAFSNGCIMYHLRYFWRIKETRLLLTLVAFINYFRRQNAINATKVWRSEPWGKGRLSNSQGGFLQVGSLKGSDDELKEKGIHGVETNEIYLS